MTRTDTDPSDLVDIWEEAGRTIVQICRSVNDDQWRAPTACPGWTVADLAAHVTDIEQLLAGDARPEHSPDWDSLPHVASDFGRFTEVGVDARRGRTRDDVLDELEDTLHRRREQLDSHPLDTDVIGPMGNPTTLDRLLRMRVFDIWAHERDIRAALDDDTAWDTAPARIAFEQIVRAFPVAWAKGAQAPDGAVAELVVSDPAIHGTFAAVVEAGRGIPADPAAESTVTPVVRLEIPWPDLVRRACGRVPADDPGLQARIRLDGDADLGRDLLRGLTITP